MEAASRFVLDRHHGITVHGGSGVILMTLVLRHLGAVGTVGRSGGGTGPKGNFDQSLRSFFFFFPFFFLMILLWHDRTEMKTLVFTVCNKESQKCFFFVLSLLLFVFVFFCFVSDPAEAGFRQHLHRQQGGRNIVTAFRAYDTQFPDEDKEGPAPVVIVIIVILRLQAAVGLNT